MILIIVDFNLPGSNRPPYKNFLATPPGKTQEPGTSTIADKPSSCFGTKKTKKIVTFDSRKLEASYTFDSTTDFVDRNNSRHVDFLWV